MKKYLILLLLASFSVEAQIVNIPDANFKAKLLEASPSNTIAQNNSLQYIKIDANDDGEIQESEALLVRNLNVSNSNISNLEGILSFTNIYYLDASYNSLSDVDFVGLNNLSFLILNNNQINSFNAFSDSGFKTLILNNNFLTSFDFSNYNNMDNVFGYVEINLNNNPLTFFNFNLNSYSFYISRLNLQNTYLETISSNFITNIHKLYLNNNSLLTTVNLTQNGVSNTEANEIYIENNPILSSFSLINSDTNQISTFEIYIQNNNQLNSVNLSNSRFFRIIIENNPISSLIINGCYSYIMRINNSNLEEIDLNLTRFNQLFLELQHNYNLKKVFLKNGYSYNNQFNQNNDLIDINFSNLPQLLYICANEWDILNIANEISNELIPNVHVNSYCSFLPEGTFYTILGNSKFDINLNGCEVNDIDIPNLKFNITNGSISGTIISNTSGDYSIPVQAGTHTITPIIENPTYFNVSPPNVAVTFPAQTSPFMQNFCVTPNGVHQDVEVVIVPLDAAIPGFDASYKLVYKNKGNTTVSGSISLTFMDNVMDFLEASPVQSSVEPNILTWDYTNLQPFETRYIYVTFNLNSTQETPALNGGDVLNFTAIIDPISGDEMVSDNTSTLNQEVVNSFDPNDKTCLEGSVVSTALIGQYVHYVVRFENTGTFFAQNVVVKDEIDVSKFDLNSLIVLSTSHQQWTRINGNKVEFIFENIQLPFPPSEERHGYIAFKIKLKNNLTVGDTFSNFASIYFDYNFPIITEPATTTIEALSNPDFEFSSFVKLYPNPTNSKITVESQTINLKSVEIFNSLGQLIQAIPNDNNQLSIDIYNLSTGTYFVKVHSDKGVGVSKFVKQ